MTEFSLSLMHIPTYSAVVMLREQKDDVGKGGSLK